MHSRRLTLALVFSIAPLLLTDGCGIAPGKGSRRAAATTPEQAEIVVRASDWIGSIRSFQGVNGGPAPLLPALPDVTRQYADIGVDLVRTHDFFGPADIDAKWPNPDQIARKVGASGARAIFPDWNADPSSPSSYNFGPTDRVVKAIVDSGAAVYFRIGRSWAADPAPPPDFDKFADVVRHVAMHYNKGWAGGYRFGIKYWEFWNEPDLEARWMPGFARPFWSGSPEQFYSLYEKVARALKDVDPNIRVGACGKAAAELAGPYREGLLQFVASRRVPFDFYSWHHYHGKSKDPHEMVGIGAHIRDLLDRAGLQAAEVHVTEWNQDFAALSARDSGGADMQRAAFLASAMIYLQDSKVDRAFFYRGDPGAMGLFDPGGRYRKQAFAFKAVAAMLKTPDRVGATGGNAHGLAVLAGRSRDMKVVQVAISNFEIPKRNRWQALLSPDAQSREFALTVDDLPWTSPDFTVKIYRLDADREFTLVEQFAGTGKTLRVRRSLPPPVLELVRIEASR